MAHLGHEHMAVDSKSSSALAVDFFLEDFGPVVLCYHHIYEQEKFHAQLSWAQKKFITSGPDLCCLLKHLSQCLG